MLRNWDFLGKNEKDENWTILRSHRADKKISIANNGNYFLQFSILFLSFFYGYFFCVFIIVIIIIDF